MRKVQVRNAKTGELVMGTNRRTGKEEPLEVYRSGTSEEAAMAIHVEAAGAKS